MFLPRILAESLGIIRVGGGRGLWLFAEIDTIVFDLVLIYAIVHCARSLRRGRAQRKHAPPRRRLGGDHEVNAQSRQPLVGRHLG